MQEVERMLSQPPIIEKNEKMSGIDDLLNYGSIKNPKKILVKYHRELYPELMGLEINPKGNFIDLRSAETVELKKGDFHVISLGISVQLPDRYWAQVVPRSSTFKNFGILCVNSFGVIDTSYCGDNDIWKMPVYATRDTVIHINDRICQFRIVFDNPIRIEEVDHLDNNDRGGIGSTGIK